MGKIFQGHCIEADESVTDFLDDIFHHYGDSCTPYMNLKGLKRMIHDLQNAGHSHDHDRSHDHDHTHHSHDHSKDPHEHEHHNECHHSNELFSLYHNHDHHSHSDNQNSASGGRFASHKHHDHDDHTDHDHDHDHSGHDHDHSIKHDRLIHSHGDDDSHSSQHVYNEHEHDDHLINSEHDHESSTPSNMVIQNLTDTIHQEEHNHKEHSDHQEEHNHKKHSDHQEEHNHKEHSDHVLRNKAESMNSSAEAEGNKDTSPVPEEIDLQPVSNISIYNASHADGHHMLHYESTIGIGSSEPITTKENIDWMSTAASSAVSSRFQRSASEDRDPTVSKDLTAESGDFNVPSSSLKSDFFHQVERQKEKDETYQQSDDVKKVYLLRNGENERQTDSTLQLNDKFASLATKCLSVEDLILKFGHQQNSSLSKGDFLDLCPALIQQIVSGVCTEPAPPPAPAPSRAEVYGYGSLSVLVISLTSLAGVLLLPVMTKRAYNYIIAGFYGLAFSTLAGDALLHLMPQFLGLHMHGSGGSHEHSHDGSFLEPYTQLQLGVFFTIYGLFLFEAILCAFSSNGHNSSQDNKSHGHSHVHIADQLPTLISVKSKSETQLPVSRDQSSSSLDTEIVDMDSIKKPPNLMVAKPLFCGLTSMALVVTLGDSIHNFGDGLAIGAAFSTGVRGGLSTAIAVFCHELPHEFGDFVVLLSTGLSFSKALVINFLSGLTCFAGLYIGIYIGDNEIARKWIMAVTAGIFLYVALGEMIPELREQGQGSPFKILLVKNLGILSGILIMLLISMYEEEMM
ncbi:zinc transporter ZIP10-like [Uloborus diversus]|uniref:zinc transporter ZIP10-like n=1 Tax=Uloborus diversus TaxID=327109 RepID=UPI0024090E2D|nr:zinc transporter ZIP10-like [Uloborus diversus]